MTRPALPAPDPAARLGAAILFVAISGQALRNLVGWWGFGAIVLVLVALSVLQLRPAPGRAPLPHVSRLPKALGVFLVLATLSIAWSAYPGAAALGVAVLLLTSVTGVFLAVRLSWSAIATALGTALRWTVGLSLVFEFVVATVVRGPVLPLWLDVPEGRIPQAFYWTRGLLFEGGPIQGIVGNRNLLGFAALLGLVVVLLEIARLRSAARNGRPLVADGARDLARGGRIVWVVLFALTLVLTRSATVALVAVAVAAVAALALWARARGEQRRGPVYLAAAAIAVVVPVSLLALRGPLLALAGRSDDLTGRLDIWSSVTALAEQRPVAGWGWVGYWVPWVEPFDGLAVRNGVTYLQAHNAWLDVWFQLGWLGLVVFAVAVLSLTWRSWFLAVDRPKRLVGDHLPFGSSALLPLLLVTALLAQSLAESRMLVEIGWVLVVTLAVKTKLREPLGASIAAGRDAVPTPSR